MIRHNEAVRVLHFAELEDAVIEDFKSARERGDGPAMREAAIIWERADKEILYG
jgi:hypothetical protein